MYIDVVLNPAEIALLPQRDLSNTTCVVFDVLRATSSMVTALAHGAQEIHPVRTIEDALALREKVPTAILGGERQGNPIPGFDVGNSPREYLDLGGRPIITTTTNGTIALRACEHAARVLVAAVINMEALIEELRRSAPENLVLVCAGTFANFSLEDAYAAGLVVEAFANATLNDSAQAVLAIAGRFVTPLEALTAADNGRALKAAGRQADVEFCAQRSRFNIVGSMQAAVVRPLPK